MNPSRASLIQRTIGRMNLRFPGLFLVLAAVLVLDFVVPDPIPFVDELVLALMTALFGLWKGRREPQPPPSPQQPPPPQPPPPPALPPGRWT